MDPNRTWFPSLRTVRDIVVPSDAPRTVYRFEARYTVATPTHQQLAIPAGLVVDVVSDDARLGHLAPEMAPNRANRPDHSPAASADGASTASIAAPTGHRAVPISAAALRVHGPSARATALNADEEPTDSTVILARECAVPTGLMYSSPSLVRSGLLGADGRTISPNIAVARTAHRDRPAFLVIPVTSETMADNEHDTSREVGDVSYFPIRTYIY